MTSDAPKKRNIKELGCVIAFRREYSAICDDDIKCGLFLSQADYWTNISIKMGRSGWFWKKHEDWYQEIGLSRSELEMVRKKLVDRGLLQEKRKGTPPVMNYRVDQAALKEVVRSLYGEVYAEHQKENAISSQADSSDLSKTANLNCGKPADANAGNLQYNTETTAKTTSKNTKYILSDPVIDADFEEFWAAYPKRVNNSKKSAKAKYIAIRKQGVQKDEIMAGTKAYANFRQRDIEQGGHQKYTKMAVHWLSGECWTNDYSITDNDIQPASKPKLSVPMASDEQMAAITAVYKGPSGDLDRAKVVLAAELVKGTELKAIVEAAQKYALYVKQMRQNGVEMAATTLDTWLKFKWREMDAYYIYRNPVDPTPVLKPKKDNGK